MKTDFSGSDPDRDDDLEYDPSDFERELDDGVGGCGALIWVCLAVLAGAALAAKCCF